MMTPLTTSMTYNCNCGLYYSHKSRTTWWLSTNKMIFQLLIQKVSFNISSLFSPKVLSPFLYFLIYHFGYYNPLKTWKVFKIYLWKHWYFRNLPYEFSLIICLWHLYERLNVGTPCFRELYDEYLHSDIPLVKSSLTWKNNNNNTVSKQVFWQQMFPYLSYLYRSSIYMQS